MKSSETLAASFVEFVPSELAQGVIYVSMEYATCTHLCACGCGHKVVTPLAPLGWTVSYDGEGVSLSPSIGNWNFPCQSHYWVRGGEIVWDRGWTRDQIARHRRRERELRGVGTTSGEPIRPNAPVQPRRRPWWRRMLGA